MSVAPAPMRERPHRLPRVCYCGEVAVAFTARLACGRITGQEAEVGKAMIAALATAARQYACEVPVYCLMPDHLHLILRGTTSNADTWKAMTAFKQRSGFWLARNLPGTRWQKDFYDHILRDESEMLAAIAYITANPFRAGLVHEPTDYPLTGSIGCDADAAA